MTTYSTAVLQIAFTKDLKPDIETVVTEKCQTSGQMQKAFYSTVFYFYASAYIIFVI